MTCEVSDFEFRRIAHDPLSIFQAQDFHCPICILCHLFLLVVPMAPKKDQKKTEKKVRTDVDEHDPDARSSTDTCFDPINRDVTPEVLAVEFGKMSLNDQRVIASSFETFQNEMKEKMKGIQSVKQIDLKISNLKKKDKKKGSKKESERFLKSKVAVKVVVGETTYEIEMYLSDRLGTLRAYLAVKMGLKRDVKFAFMKDGEVFKNKKGEQASMSTFLYTLGFVDGMTVHASIINEEEKPTETSPTVDAMPIGGVVAFGGGQDDDDDFVNETLEMMGLADGDAEDEVSDAEDEADAIQDQ